MTLEEKAELADQYAQAQNRLMMLAEGYPQLQASVNFLQLQETIADVEEHLQAARRAYNANVARYNEKLQMFPSSLIAGMIHAEAKAFFQAELDPVSYTHLHICFFVLSSVSYHTVIFIG